MTFFSLLALAVAMFIFALTPGPGVFATVARALASGFRPALFCVAGIVLGDLVFLLLSIFGLSAIAEQMGEFFILVKYLGGAYLIWLGINILRNMPKLTEIETEELTKTGEKQTSFLTGLIITLSNPKVILFYLGFLPAFLDLNALSMQEVIWVAIVISVVLSAVLIGYAWMATQARQKFQSSRAMKRLNQTAGGIMVTTGAVLVMK